MDFRELVSLVSRYAPILGTVLGGPAGSIAGNLIADVFGHDHKSPGELIQKIISDPESSSKLKEIEFKNKEILMKNSTANYDLFIKDKISARDTQSQQIKELHERDWIIHFLATAFTVGLFLYLATSYFVVQKFDTTIFHDLLNVEMLICSFYFGSAYRSNK